MSSQGSHPFIDAMNTTTQPRELWHSHTDDGQGFPDDDWNYDETCDSTPGSPEPDDDPSKHLDNHTNEHRVQLLEAAVARLGGERNGIRDLMVGIYREIGIMSSQCYFLEQGRVSHLQSAQDLVPTIVEKCRGPLEDHLRVHINNRLMDELRAKYAELDDFKTSVMRKLDQLPANPSSHETGPVYTLMKEMNKATETLNQLRAVEQAAKKTIKEYGGSQSVLDKSLNRFKGQLDVVVGEAEAKLGLLERKADGTSRRVDEIMLRTREAFDLMREVQDQCAKWGEGLPRDWDQISHDIKETLAAARLDAQSIGDVANEHVKAARASITRLVVDAKLDATKDDERKTPLAPANGPRPGSWRERAALKALENGKAAAASASASANGLQPRAWDPAQAPAPQSAALPSDFRKAGEVEMSAKVEERLDRMEDKVDDIKRLILDQRSAADVRLELVRSILTSKLGTMVSQTAADGQGVKDCQFSHDRLTPGHTTAAPQQTPPADSDEAHESCAMSPSGTASTTLSNLEANLLDLRRDAEQNMVDETLDDPTAGAPSPQPAPLASQPNRADLQKKFWDTLSERDQKAWPKEWPIFWEGGDPTGLGRDKVERTWKGKPKRAKSRRAGKHELYQELHQD